MKRIVVDIAGGFGNQMFCYAFGYTIAKEKNCELWIDTTYQDNGITWACQLDNMNVQYTKRLSYKWTRKFLDRAIFNKLRRKNAVGWFINHYQENSGKFCSDVFDINKDTYFTGNWENEKYILKYKSDICQMYTPKNKRSESVEKLRKEMEESCSVGIHVRRGDKAAVGNSLRADYYERAIKAVYDILGDKAVFYVFTDDIAWCRENLTAPGINLIFPEYTSDNHAFDDWLLLRTCHHHVIGNSTFSWWAAWLHDEPDHLVYCPEGEHWFAQGWRYI